MPQPINRRFTPEVGMALATKNGQRMGNATIIAKEESEHGTLYVTTTDFGNTMRLTENEVHELFEVANWWKMQQEKSEEFYTPYLTGFNDPLQRIRDQLELLQEALTYLEGKK